MSLLADPGATGTTSLGNDPDFWWTLGSNIDLGRNLELDLSGREYEATSPGEADELQNPYLDDDRLDLSGWARDLIGLSLPDKILCRTDCAGLCPVCGKDLNKEPHDHGEAEPDSRWAPLAELRDRL